MTRRVWREKDLVAAIDVGTTKVCVVLAGRSPSGQLDVLSHSSVPSGGVRRGTVEEVANAELAVRRSIEQVKEQSGFRVQSAFVGITGTHIAFENRRHTLDGVGKDGVIIGSDLAVREDEGVEADGRRRLHAIRMSYSVDGKKGIRDPRGMHIDKLGAETHVISGEAELIDRLSRAVENAGVTVAGMVLEPLASGLAVLTPHEMGRGALLVDIGGGTTDIVGYKRGRICYTGVIPVGGWQFTNDIAVTFGTTYEAAEAAKLECADTEIMAHISESIPMGIPEGGDLQVPVIDICQLTRERAQELARLVKTHLKDADLGDPSQVSLVLTGGASSLPGMTSLMERQIGIRTRQGIPGFEGEAPDELRAPAHATGLGILMWADAEHRAGAQAKGASGKGRTRGGRTGFLPRLMGSVAKLSPSKLFGNRKRRS
jgi:cell division protein FtsA